jgi:diaminohydroxyphosphoribosylaminopyrimidine deaminase/5-amino-6-(5-phosphoribosylamino)uracil reductase
VFRGRRPLPQNAKLWQRDPIVVEPTSNGVVSVNDSLFDLARLGITSVLVEGGAHIARSFIDADAVDEIVVYVGAILAGGTGLPALAGSFATIADALPLTFTGVDRIGPDLKITARIERNI